HDCTVCRAPTTKKCARCSTTFYCSTAHQKLDWKKHKLACLPPAIPLPTVVKTRAEAEHDRHTKFAIDVILLPWDSETPRLVKSYAKCTQIPTTTTSLASGSNIIARTWSLI
ncbi:hypothetical protein B0H12DRAFT_1016096, partial [Mycena haematopus]